MLIVSTVGCGEAQGICRDGEMVDRPKLPSRALIHVQAIQTIQRPRAQTC